MRKSIQSKGGIKDRARTAAFRWSAPGPDKERDGRNTFQLIVWMSFQLGIPGGLLSSRARFRFPSR